MENPLKIDSQEKTPEKKQYHVAVVDIHDLKESAARDAGDAAMTAHKDSAGWFSKVWKHNLWKDVYRLREINIARNKIESTQNLLAGEGIADKDVHQQETKAIVERFTSEYEETISKERGESKESLGNSEEEQRFKEGLKALIRDYAEGKIEEAAFEEERVRLVSSLSSERSVGQREIMYADNVFEIAKQVKIAMDHGAGLDALDFDLQVTLGKAKSSVRTEAQFNNLERIIEKVKNSKIGSFINETTLTSGLAIAYTIAARASRAVANSRLAAWTTFGATALLGGGIAAAKEAVRLKEERRQHLREVAKGKTFNPEEAPRRKEMEEFRYEMKSAADLASSLENSLYDTAPNGDRVQKELSQEEFEAALALLADIEARIHLSDKRSIDLIGYSDIRKIEQERTKLDILRAQAKVDLGKMLVAEKTVAKEKQEFSYEIPDFLSSEEIYNFVQSLEYKNESDQKKKEDVLAFWISERRLEKGHVIPEIEADHGSFTDAASAEYAKWDHARMEEIMRALAEAEKTETVKIPSALKVPNGKDLKSFLADISHVEAGLLGGENGIERKDELFAKMRNKRVAKVAIKALLTGLVVGSIAQEGMAFMRDDQTGLVEHFVKGDKAHLSALHHFTPLEGLRRWIKGDLPHSLPATQEIRMAGADFKVPAGMSLVPTLGHHGFNLIGQDHEVLLRDIPLDAHGRITDAGREILENNGVHVTTGVHAVMEHGSGEVLVQGPVQPDAVAVAAKDYISKHESLFSRIKRDLWYDNDTPKPIFDKNELRLDVDMDAKGNFIFDMHRMRPDGSYHDDFSANARELMKGGKLKMLLSLSRETQHTPVELAINEHGRAIIDPHSEMAKLFFRTVNGKPEFIGKFAEVGQSMGGHDGADHFRILATEIGHERISPLGLIPNDHRLIPLSKLDIPNDYRIDPPYFIPLFGRAPLEPAAIPAGYAGYARFKAREGVYAGRRSETLLKDKEAKLNATEETKKYFLRQTEEWRSEVESLSEQMEPMSSKCQMVVCIPVAGHQESANIYKTLEWYKKQQDERGNKMDPSAFEVLLFVNYPEGKKADDVLKEIKRFRRDNPNINVRIAEKSLSPQEAKIGTIRKYATDLALFRNLARGKDEKDIFIISNDADCRGMDPSYLSNFSRIADEHPQMEAVLGKLDWEPEAYIRSPLLHIGTRFFQYLDAVYRHHPDHEIKGTGSSGANFAFKSSIYAAVGGYVESDTIAEDRNLGEAIRSARNRKAVPIWYGGSRSLVVTNARRGIDAIQRGLAPAEQWSTDFGPDDSIRDKKWNINESADLQSPSYQETLRRGLERFIQRTLRVYNLEASSWEARKAMSFMGIKYRLEGDKVRITDITKLLDGLRDYSREGLGRAEARLSPPGG